MASDPSDAAGAAAASAGAGVSEEAMEDCMKWRAKAMKDPTVEFMFEHMGKAGCGMPAASVVCTRCDKSVRGGFHPSDGVILCANHIDAYSQVRDTIVHELVHAYDECRAYMDWTNCVHHACSEIRAANLSGECSWINEFNRGNANLEAQQAACVKRRAGLSISHNPACAGSKGIEAINAAWDACYNDTRPFDYAP